MRIFEGFDMKTLVLASPRGFCAGVTRAIGIVEKALEIWGPPVYVKHEIVHNKFVVGRLREKGAIFVEEISEIPPGSNVIFSAHGVPPATFDEAIKLELNVTDATCPLVTKVHKEARRFAEKGVEILYIGHKNHVEAIGTRGVAPELTKIVESVEEATKVTVDNPEKVAVLTQTTLSVDDTKEIQDTLLHRFKELQTPRKGDICYATTNRQTAIKQICAEVELVLVVGSSNSSNSNRLREVASRMGVQSYLINSHHDIQESWLDGVERIGMTAGASTPEEIIERCIDRLKELGVKNVQEKQIIPENVTFNLPKMNSEVVSKG